MYIYNSVCFVFLQTSISYSTVCKLKDIYFIHTLDVFLEIAGVPL